MKYSRFTFILIAAIFVYIMFLWLNTRNTSPKEIIERKFELLSNYIEDTYKINPYDFNILKLEHYDDSVYETITNRLEINKINLVLYVPENACNDCIIREYEKLTLLPDFMQEKTFIMTSFSKRRDVNMWINSRKYKYPVYNNPHFGLTDFGSTNQITLFIVRQSGIPTNFMIIKQYFPEASDKYYKFIVSLFEHGNYLLDKTAIEEIEKSTVKYSNKHDFGLVNQKDTININFEFETISDSPFVITDVKTNCGCTVPEWDHIPVNKGLKANVKVKYIAENIGVFSQRITVFSNAEDSPHVLIISGNVR